MLVTKQPVLRRFWYPVMPSTLLNGEPQPFKLLGSDIVLWRGANGAVACLQDRCCHRTAKLSLGFVEDGHLVCGYHGWTYRSDGVCVRIPQRGNPTKPSPGKLAAAPNPHRRPSPHPLSRRFVLRWLSSAGLLTGTPLAPGRHPKPFTEAAIRSPHWSAELCQDRPGSPTRLLATKRGWLRAVSSNQWVRVFSQPWLSAS